jgi:dipeptidyl aminopeptidase
MKTLETNLDGYMETAVSKMEGFKNTKFLLASGTADDNVHFHNAANLVWKLVGAGISTNQYRVQYFTDAAHSLYLNGAHPIVMNMIKNFVCDAFSKTCAN